MAENAQITQSVLLTTGGGPANAQVTQSALLSTGGNPANAQVTQAVLLVLADATGAALPQADATPAANLWFYDHRDGRVYPAVLPNAPPAPTVNVLANPASQVFDWRGGADGSALSAPFTVINAGHFDSIGWNTEPFGFTAPRMNTSGSTVAGDGFIYDCSASPLDHRSVAAYTLKVESSGEGVTGGIANLVWGQTAYPDPNEHSAPIVITKSNTPEVVTVRVADLPASARSSIKYMGVKFAIPVVTVLSVTDLQIQTGITAKHRYKLADVQIEGIGATEFPCAGLASGYVEADLGDVGATAHLTLPPPAAGINQRKLYRQDFTAAGVPIEASFRFLDNIPHDPRWEPGKKTAVGDKVTPAALGFALPHTFIATADGTTGSTEPAWTGAGGATYSDGTAAWKETGIYSVSSYDDVIQDVSTAARLKEARAQVPCQPDSIGIHHDRLMLSVSSDTTDHKRDGSVWLSALADATTWLDVTPSQVPDLVASGTLQPTDGLRIPLGEIGKVFRMESFGTTTADSWQQGTLLMSRSRLVLLQGDTPETFDVGHQRVGGVAGYEAACKDKTGNVLMVDNEGVVMQVDSRLNPLVLSFDLHRALVAIPNRAVWVAGYDPWSNRLVLATSTRLFWQDLNLYPLIGPASRLVYGGWGEIDVSTVPLPSCAAVAGVGDGSYLAFGGASGRIRRVFDSDPAAALGGWSYKTADFNALPRRLRPYRIWGDATGTVTATVYIDGVAQGAYVIGRRWKPIGRRDGRRISVRLVGAAGAVLNSLEVEIAPTEG